MLLWFIVGYIVHVVFPIPWLTGFIYNMWAELMLHIGDWVKGSNMTTQQPIIPPAKPTDSVP